ncbi:2-amino-4-hydroxy-6-hydroxymethyldihydropteridine diphosphokinase [Candidatus Anaplasma sp. TIGMIC]|uniref:2-amino-4-hydroxy-6- hydroxymethyldihydropteridine diphosphokinase n=1 Tax=Candidatus Anaplasma sp. TIGMIC TaxID=3020713 RepID=UPI00232DAFEA|nr:2-amino-4-hydroxy-6-hydroxymethyldihydropteridine diphosphokinase [Candidatus Anaplasma sp. TIGMIC]MDB1135792.1 2-amino-4-hydroxy-6-hydroxymethyldihydropteridine diphosphokinase [Candidatus Anaplasma sp. TIGMIC]
MVVLALGSNVGNRLENLRKAAMLLPLDGKEFSPIYESRALLPSGAPSWWDTPFLNAVISGGTNLSPTSLLKCAKQIEYSLGRFDHEFWGPRTIDIDLVLWENTILDSDALTLPHKLMHTRDFVLVPTCDICPQFSHPVLTMSIEALLLAQKNVETVKKHPRSYLSQRI